MPVIGQGTWNLERVESGQAVATLRAGLDLGMTHVDTAEMYGAGRVEEVVGEAIAGRRDEVFLVSKVLPRNASFAGTLRACEASLQRLRTDRLDAYLLHWPGAHPLEQTVAAFERLQRDGKIRAYGVSNFDADEIDDAVAIAGDGRIGCNQVLYHLRERAIEEEVIPRCAHHGVAVVAYSPFGSGRFPAPASSGGRVLGAVAHGRGTTPRQVALAFLVRRADVFAIPKASTLEHVRENATAGDLVLTQVEVKRLAAAFPRGRSRRRLPMV